MLFLCRKCDKLIRRSIKELDFKTKPKNLDRIEYEGLTKVKLRCPQCGKKPEYLYKRRLESMGIKPSIQVI